LERGTSGISPANSISVPARAAGVSNVSTTGWLLPAASAS
jgi:hypothetical protein